MQDYGGKIDSIDEYDEMLDRWGEMLEAGDSAGAMDMLGQRLPDLPEGDELEDYLSKVVLLHDRSRQTARYCAGRVCSLSRSSKMTGLGC